MSTAQEIDDRSLHLAGGFLESARKEIEVMGGGDFAANRSLIE